MISFLLMDNSYFVIPKLISLQTMSEGAHNTVAIYQSDMGSSRHNYLSYLRSLDSDEGGDKARLDYLRAALNQAATSFEVLHGPELAMRVQLCFLQGLPLFLSSRMSARDAMVFVDNILGRVSTKTHLIRNHTFFNLYLYFPAKLHSVHQSDKSKPEELRRLQALLLPLI